MKQVIWKYLITPGECMHQIPAGAEFLSVQTQHEQPHIWFLVDPTADKVPYTFVARPTGVEWDRDPVTRREVYLDTFQLEHGRLVFHLFRIFEAR